MGLVSFIYEKVAFGTLILPRLKPQLTLAIASGLIFAVVVVVLDLAFMPFMGKKFAEMAAQDTNLLAQLGMGFLYGGIAEELLLRWGVMSLLVWLGWKLLGRSGDSPPNYTLYTWSSSFCILCYHNLYRYYIFFFTNTQLIPLQ